SLSSSEINPPFLPSALIWFNFILKLSRKARILLLLPLFGLIWLYSNHSRLGHPNIWNSIFNFKPFSKSYEIPKVSRNVQSQLEKLVQFLDHQSLTQELQTDNLVSDTEIPLVTALPVSKSFNSQSSTPQQPQCPGHFPSPCSFLLIGFIGEQETKAQIHLHQLGLLALALNRILVLPQVKNSRMGSCLDYPFDLYYDHRSLKRLVTPIVTHDEFIKWSNSLITSPSARIVSIVEHKLAPSFPIEGAVSYNTSIPEDVLPTKPDRKFCLSNGLKNLNKKSKLTLNFKSFAPLTIVAPHQWYRKTQSKNFVANMIINSTRQSNLPSSTDNSNDNKLQLINPDVLVLNYELRYPFLDPLNPESQRLLSIEKPKNMPKITHISPSKFNLLPFRHFEYTPIWVTLADIIFNQLPPMVAIHWRQETLSIKNLRVCANSLINILDSLKNSYPSLQVVYLSTDYPIEAIHHPQNLENHQIAHSGTFSKSLSHEHHLIMKELLEKKFKLKWMTFDRAIDQLKVSKELIEKLSKLPNMIELSQALKSTPARFLTLEKQQEFLRSSLRKLDHGLVGILEKMLLIRSNAFMTGVPNECSKSSSFTKQVISSRQFILDQKGQMNQDYSDFRVESLEKRKSKILNLVEYWN
ncbi:hypothetical protein O181_099803, partial [Austropuccinia psidii MF-1]|nr:hypothetical protein [Austropuccinia psidii MF-1]